jgi:hypothetical protein
MSAANVVTPKNHLPNPLRLLKVGDALLRAAGVRLTSPPRASHSRRSSNLLSRIKNLAQLWGRDVSLFPVFHLWCRFQNYLS